MRGFTVGILTSIFVDRDYNDSLDHLQFTRAAIFRLHFLKFDGNVRDRHSSFHFNFGSALRSILSTLVASILRVSALSLYHVERHRFEH